MSYGDAIRYLFCYTIQVCLNLDIINGKNQKIDKVKMRLSLNTSRQFIQYAHFTDIVV